MKELIMKLLFTSIAGMMMLAFTIPWGYFGINMPFSGPDFRLGLDLQGGIELDYTVDLSEAMREENFNNQRKNEIIEGLKSIIDRRVETLNINDSIITSANYAGEEHIIVQIPLKGNDELENSDNIERAKEAIGRVVRIEFKESRQEITDADRVERLELVNIITEDLKAHPEFFTRDIRRFQDRYEGIVTGETSDVNSIFTSDSTTLFDEEGAEIISNTGIYNSNGEEGTLVITSNEDRNEYIFISHRPSAWKPAMDSTGRVLDDRYFVNASVQFSETFQPMVELTFNSQGAQIFGELTRRLVGKPIAIFVGGELLTSPNVNEPILSGRAVVTGNFTPDEASELAREINTGVVPAPIFLTSERTIDARLGENSLERIIFAGGVSFLVILVFLVYIYRFSGLISALSLFIYVVLVLFILKQFSIVLTLASIAGLVLSLGIAIDANILIFERIKDELRKKKKLRDAVEEGFTQSFSAIWDANLTGLIVALILFIFGINMIKGFGLILGLGIVVSLFSVYFISRLYIRLLSRTHISQTNFIGKI
ncbi:protein translocase subunit SecD [Candidatus Gracilibacteria bacterium]|nr:protein translocase subunit SecD [Candidatus Gracilibacteria bacterium]